MCRIPRRGGVAQKRTAAFLPCNFFHPKPMPVLPLRPYRTSHALKPHHMLRYERKPFRNSTKLVFNQTALFLFIPIAEKIQKLNGLLCSWISTNDSMQNISWKFKHSTHPCLCFDPSKKSFHVPTHSPSSSHTTHLPFALHIIPRTPRTIKKKNQWTLLKQTKCTFKKNGEVKELVRLSVRELGTNGSGWKWHGGVQEASKSFSLPCRSVQLKVRVSDALMEVSPYSVRLISRCLHQSL